MNVLSLFDGISCGQIALHRAGIQYENYFASEIDKYAIKITQKNYPNTIQLGDVNNWIDWNLPKIDLLIGGSPCQGFSHAGEGMNFADPRSRLFFKFVDCLKWYQPTFFMLENVKMKKEWRDIITSYMGVEPILINSALVSAQNRERYYWTSIPNVTQPEDKHIYLRDVIEQGGENPIVLHNIYGGFKETKPRVFVGKSPTIRTSAGGGHIPSVITGAALRNQITPRGVEYQLNIRQDYKSNWVVPTYPKRLNGMIEGEDYRTLLPIECERLQTIPDDYTKGVSNTQRYKAVGNGWTIDVIAHIFKGLKQWQ